MGFGIDEDIDEADFYCEECQQYVCVCGDEIETGEKMTDAEKIERAAMKKAADHYDKLMSGIEGWDRRSFESGFNCALDFKDSAGLFRDQNPKLPDENDASPPLDGHDVADAFNQGVVAGLSMSNANPDPRVNELVEAVKWCLATPTQEQMRDREFLVIFVRDCIQAKLAEALRKFEGRET